MLGNNIISVLCNTSSPDAQTRPGLCGVCGRGVEKGMAMEVEKGIAENAPKEITGHSLFESSRSDKKKGSVNPL